ncbi:MAG: dihydropteroate synthase [Marinifilaceae bacterium]
MNNIKINNKVISFDSPLIMGILNLTPDSFYDGGSYINDEQIIERIEKILSDGADIIDLGAYSSRPGAEHISEELEVSRLLPAIRIIAKYFPDVIVSVDTFRASVVEKIHEIYDDFIINDISGGTMDDRMYNIVVKLDLPYIMMHMKGTPQNMQSNPIYDNVVEEVYEYFSKRIEILKAKGYNKIILDPGFGFGKTLEHNYEILRNMDKYKSFGFPVLAGVSRKSMICKLLKCNPSEALTGTIAINTLSLGKGADILRVHDVKDAVETVKIFNAFKKGIID